MVSLVIDNQIKQKHNHNHVKENEELKKRNRVLRRVIKAYQKVLPEYDFPELRVARQILKDTDYIDENDDNDDDEKEEEKEGEGGGGGGGGVAHEA